MATQYDGASGVLTCFMTSRQDAATTLPNPEHSMTLLYHELHASIFFGIVLMDSISGTGDCVSAHSTCQERTADMAKHTVDISHHSIVRTERYIMSGKSQILSSE